MKRICVFLGSSGGLRPEYSEAARQLGGELVRRNPGLVYGGAIANGLVLFRSGRATP